MKKIITIQRILLITLTALSAYLYSCNSSGTAKERMLLNVPLVINKSSEDIVDMMGKPDSIYNFGSSLGPALVHRYKRNGIEIYYVNNQAKEIIIREPKPVKFDMNYIKYIGIIPKDPPDYIIDSTVISWSNIPGYAEIALITQAVDDKNFDYFIMVKAE
ncbi:MAG: hypothetical protein NW226_05190 [Microscillaceae bacterium]|nr:hypothetical protein [Microscillaceae bacterium]